MNIESALTKERCCPALPLLIGRASGMSRTDVWYMVRRRACDAGIETAIRFHSFRATGITDYLTNGGRIKVAKRMAGHPNAKTTGLYDWPNDDISVGKVERIGI
jgi:site-specific recombinase XerD